MATANFATQEYFDLYATEGFWIYPNMLDDNDDYILDQNGAPVIDYDAEPYFDDDEFQRCKEYADKLNAHLDFFNIDFESGYYNGIQTFINPQTSDFDALDFLDDPTYYNKSDLFAEFGVNSYILKLKILKEIKFINEKLLPELARMFSLSKLNIVAQFSNGETMYAKAN